MKLSKRGISLIVLVITIVVMIILATAIILTLTGSNIVGKANEAKISSDIANIREAASVYLAEYNLKVAQGKIDKEEISAKEYVEGALLSQGLDLMGMMVTEDGKVEIVTPDTIKPSATLEIITGENNAISVKVTQTDDRELDISKCKWVFKTSADELGIENETLYTGTFTQSEQTIPLEGEETGDYFLHILTVDKAGNKKETVSQKITKTAYISFSIYWLDCANDLSKTYTVEKGTTWGEFIENTEFEEPYLLRVNPDNSKIEIPWNRISGSTSTDVYDDSAFLFMELCIHEEDVVELLAETPIEEQIYSCHNSEGSGPVCGSGGTP